MGREAVDALKGLRRTSLSMSADEDQVEARIIEVMENNPDELRRVTHLFCDLVINPLGVTGLSEDEIGMVVMFASWQARRMITEAATRLVARTNNERTEQ